MITRETSFMQRRVLIIVCDTHIDVGGFEQSLDCRVVASLASKVERGNAVLCLGVDIHMTVVYKKLYGFFA